MDNYSKLANSILIEHTSILKENQLAEISPQSGQSFGDFLKGLQGKSRKDIFDAASYARLYIGNAYGMTSAANDDANPKVLMSKFLSTLANYINQNVMDYRPGLAETEEFKNKYGYSEYQEQEKERRELARNFMLMPSGPEKDAKRRIYNAFRNTSEYAEAMRAQNKKEDQMVRDFHNRPIKPGDIVNDGSEEFMRLQEMYNKIQGAQHAIEDQESGIRSLDGFFSDEEAHIEDQEVDMNTVERGLSDLAATASSGAKGLAGKLLGTKAQAAKASLDKRAKAVAKAIPAYDAVTKKLEQGYKDLLKTAK